MEICKVVKKVVSTIKNKTYKNLPLLLVQPVHLNMKNKGNEILCIDFVGADLGELVLIMKEGTSVNDMLGQNEAPADAAIIGIIDNIEGYGQKIFDKSNPD